MRRSNAMPAKRAQRASGGARHSKSRKKKWSQRVTRESSALALESGVFTREPRAVALSLKRSAEKSKRRKTDPYRSAMSMLTFYINRAGKQLSKTDRARLERAKDELRKLYHKPPRRSTA